MSKYYYLDVTLKFDKPKKGDKTPNITAVLYKNHIMQCMKQRFGEIEGNTTLDVLKFDENKLQSILRVPIEDYQKLRCSLTLCGSYDGFRCAFRVNKASQILLALSADSRTYEH